MDRERSKWDEIPTPGHKKTRRRQPDRSRNPFLMKKIRFKAFRTLSTLLKVQPATLSVAFSLAFSPEIILDSARLWKKKMTIRLDLGGF